MLNGELVDTKLLKNVSFTGDTKHFEHYYGKIYTKTSIVFYRFIPSRTGGKYIAHDIFGGKGKNLESRTLSGFIKKVRGI